jgi:hypothetical protein
MRLDIDKMKEIAYQSYLPTVARIFGGQGTIALRTLLENIKNIYGWVNPELINGTLLIFQQVTLTALPQGLPPLQQHFTSLSYLAPYLKEGDSETTVIQVIDSNHFDVWKNIKIDLNELSADCIVYCYSSNSEFFVIQGNKVDVINPSSLHASIFAIPAFRELSEALEDYRWRSIRTSRCHIFTQIWRGGENSSRLHLVNKPEETMRRSLTQYLHNVLPGAIVHPEVNVDETHPVDIQVAWFLTNRVAIIEIKWLGDSITADGNVLQYRDARAREGAKQLAEYLDAKHKWAPVNEVTGYLVVIDARRHGLNLGLTSIDKKNGLWYQDKEINFEPEYHSFRADFVEPIRMFAEPVCQPA